MKEAYTSSFEKIFRVVHVFTFVFKSIEDFNIRHPRKIKRPGKEYTEEKSLGTCGV